MGITSDDIERKTFSPAGGFGRHGYNTDEVDAFLDQLSAELDALNAENADLRSRLEVSERKLSELRP